jgi:hypothetical protein
LSTNGTNNEDFATEEAMVELGSLVRELFMNLHTIGTFMETSRI